VRCRSCRRRLDEDHDPDGARCPHCRAPLFEKREAPVAVAEPDAGICALHPGSAVAATCQRCGNYMCLVCRTRWRNQSLCAECVARLLETGQAVPGEQRSTVRQGVVALVLALSAWGLCLVGLVLAGVAVAVGNNIGLLLLSMLAIFGGAAAALIGLGQAASAVRARGDAMILATIALLLSSLYLGAIIGLFGISALQQ
jgi:hypothetical protein